MRVISGILQVSKPFMAAGVTVMTIIFGGLPGEELASLRT